MPSCWCRTGISQWGGVFFRRNVGTFLILVLVFGCRAKKVRLGCFAGACGIDDFRKHCVDVFIIHLLITNVIVCVEAKFMATAASLVALV